MPRKLQLKNIEKYMNINKDSSFSLYDYIYHEVAISEINTDIYFALLEVYWPSFVLYNGYVFLKEKFMEQKFNTFNKQQDDIEYWMNFLTIDGYFENDEDGEEKAETLSRTLVDIWATKLKRDFPLREFVVLYLEDKEFGDYGLTFYQKKHRDNESRDFGKEQKTILQPNIKENSINQNPDGSRKPGKSRIRAAKQNEIPNS